MSESLLSLTVVLLLGIGSVSRYPLRSAVLSLEVHSHREIHFLLLLSQLLVLYVSCVVLDIILRDLKIAAFEVLRVAGRVVARILSCLGTSLAEAVGSLTLGA